MKHRNYEAICAKAENMDLVVCINNHGEWQFGDLSQLVAPDAFPTFLCLPQHKDVCLHWLNGGAAQYASNGTWVSFGNWEDCIANPLFMRSDVYTRIKPRKEKRWIAIYGTDVMTKLFKTCADCKDYVAKDTMYSLCSPEAWQFIEIEVEL